MGELLSSLSAMLRDGVTLEELGIFSVLTAGFVLCVYAIVGASVKIVASICTAISGIFGNSVRAISDGLHEGMGVLLRPTNPKEGTNEGKSY